MSLGRVIPRTSAPPVDHPFRHPQVGRDISGPAFHTWVVVSPKQGVEIGSPEVFLTSHESGLPLVTGSGRRAQWTNGLPEGTERIPPLAGVHRS